MRFFFLYISITILITASCVENSHDELKKVEELQDIPVMQAADLTTTVTDSGYIKYDFTTPKMLQYDNIEVPYIDFPYGLKFRNFEQHGTVISSKIRCNNAKYYKSKQLWELNNDVEATTQKGDILNTEQLFWDVERKKIYSEKFVRITTKNQVITGIGFESDDQLTYYEIKKPGGEIELQE